MMSVAACPGYVGDDSTIPSGSTSRPSGLFTNSSIPATPKPSNSPTLPPSVNPSVTKSSESIKPSTSAVTDPKCQTGDWENVFFGSGVVLDADNPAANGTQPVTINIDGTKSACDAVAACISSAQSNNFHTIDVHFLSNSNQWVCTAYLGELDDNTYFDTKSEFASRTYGYSLPLSSTPDGNVTDPKCTGTGNFTIFHFDSGFTLGTANSANANSSFPPLNETYSGSADDRCDIAGQCAALAEENDYSTFEIFFTSSNWTCIAYYGFTDDDSEFDTPSDAEEVYGFSSSRTGLPSASCDFDEWESFFNGTGLFINENNPANNESSKAKEKSFDGDLEDCKAIQACIDFADQNEYETVEVEQRTNNGTEWYCRIFFGLLDDDSFFSEPAAFIQRAYGYALSSGSNNTNGSEECVKGSFDAGNFTEFYRGSGKILNETNSANVDSFFPFTTTFPGNDTDCNIISACLDFAVDNDYSTVDIHHVVNNTDDSWECIAYYGSTNDSSEFDTLDASVEIAYGYTLPETDLPDVVDPQCDVGLFSIFFNGRGSFLPTTNKANDNPTKFPSHTSTIAASKDECDAIADCFTAAKSYGYHTFNVYGDGLTPWTCDVYHGYTDDPAEVKTSTDPTKLNTPSYVYSLKKFEAKEPDCGLLNGFKNFYFGSDYTLKDGNVADTAPPKKFETYLKTVSRCQALENCQVFADSTDWLTFNLYFETNLDKWVCNTFKGYTVDKTEFSTPNSFVSEGYGYSFPKVVVDKEPDCTGEKDFGKWKNFYFGTGNQINSVNDANTDGTKLPKTATYTVSQFKQCDVIDSCITLAKNNAYKTISIIYNDIDDEWTCTAFFGRTTDATKFNQADTKISQGYGYSLPPVEDITCTDVGGLVQFYAGEGKKLATTGEHNSFPNSYAPKTGSYTGAVAAPCVAAKTCVTEKLGDYGTLQLVFNTATSKWDCTTYYGKTTNKALLSVDDATANPVYALSRDKPAAVNPACTNLGTYAFYHVGRGKTVDAAGKAWNDKAERTENYALNTITSDCQAVKKCSDFAANAHYHTFDVHIKEDTQNWVCTAWHGVNTVETVYSVDAAQVPIAYGYSAPVATVPDCGTTFTSTAGKQFKKFYSGTGKRLKTDNAANQDNTKLPKTLTTQVGSTGICAAAKACADFAVTNSYKTFDLVFDNTAPGWKCTAYAGVETDSAAFTDESANYEEGVGYYDQTLSAGPNSGTFTERYTTSDFVLKKANPANPREDYKPAKDPESDLISAYDTLKKQVDKCASTANYFSYSTFQTYISDNGLNFYCQVFAGELIAGTDVSSSLQALGYSSPVRVYSKPVTDPTCFSSWTRITNPKLTGVTLKADNSAVQGETVYPDTYTITPGAEICDTIVTCRQTVEYNHKTYHTVEFFLINAGPDAGKARCRAYKGQLASVSGETTPDANVGDLYVFSTAQDFNAP